MLMKVFNKGQIVIPSYLRKILGIEVGDMMEVDVDLKKACLELKKPSTHKTHLLAGCFSKRKIAFPSRKKMHKALARGLSHEK